MARTHFAPTELLDPTGPRAINIPSLRDSTTSILITRALVSSTPSALATAALPTLPALAFRLDLGSRHQTQLTVGHHLLAGFQSVFDHGHGVGYGAGFDHPHLDG